jgi:HEAT repeat protein
MLDDSSPNVRYNAATGLARHGHAAALPVVLEMLNPDNPDAVVGESSLPGRTWKQEAVLVNGLRATQQWAQQNPQADREPLIAAIQTLLHADLTASVRTLARQALRAISTKPKP